MKKDHLIDEQLLTTFEVSKYMKVSLRTLQKWRDQGLLSYTAIGRKFYYQMGDLKKMISTFKAN